MTPLYYHGSGDIVRYFHALYRVHQVAYFPFQRLTICLPVNGGWIVIFISMTQDLTAGLDNLSALLYQDYKAFLLGFRECAKVSRHFFGPLPSLGS